MSSHEARAILLRYRPGTSDGEDPEVAEALRLVESDAELRQWFQQHCAFQQEVRRQLQAVPVPPPNFGSPRIVRGPAIWWTRGAAIAAMAAAFVALAIVTWYWLKPAPADRFENYRLRMAGSAVRQYSMDIETSDMNALRQFQSQKGAPTDYRVPDPLKPLPLTGGGVHRWRDKPVSMVCFDRGQKQMVFLFVVDRASVRNPPSAEPEFAQVNKLVTASWSEGSRAYLLATEGNDTNEVRKYLY